MQTAKFAVQIAVQIKQSEVIDGIEYCQLSQDLEEFVIFRA